MDVNPRLRDMMWPDAQNDGVLSHPGHDRSRLLWEVPKQNKKYRHHGILSLKREAWRCPTYIVRLRSVLENSDYCSSSWVHQQLGSVVLSMLENSSKWRAAAVYARLVISAKKEAEREREAQRRIRRYLLSYTSVNRRPPERSVGAPYNRT